MKVLVVIIILLSFHSFGQFPATLYFNGGYSVDKFNPEGINEFSSTFNQFWAGELEEDWGTLKGSELSAPIFGIGFKSVSEKTIAFSWATGFQYQAAGFKNQTTWNSGVVQHYKFRSRDYLWTAQAGVAWNNMLRAEFYLAGGMRSLGLRYTTRYQDGSESIGTEYRLNGYYSGRIALFELGGELSCQLGPLALFARYSAGLKNFPPGKGLVVLMDDSSNILPPTDFPSNYTTYATDPVTFIEDNDGMITDNFQVNRFTFGVYWVL